MKHCYIEIGFRKQNVYYDYMKLLSDSSKDSYSVKAGRSDWSEALNSGYVAVIIYRKKLKDDTDDFASKNKKDIYLYSVHKCY